MAAKISAERESQIASASLKLYFTKRPVDNVSYKKHTLTKFMQKAKSFGSGKQIELSAHKSNYRSQYVRAKNLSIGTLAYEANNPTALLTFDWYSAHTGRVLDIRTCLEQGLEFKTEEGQVTARDNMVQIFNVWGQDLYEMRESFREGLNQDLWLGDGTDTIGAGRVGTTDPDETAANAAVRPLGIANMIRLDNDSGTVGGIDTSQAGNAWFRNLSKENVAAADLIDDIEELTREATRYGGGPKMFVCGSDFFDALRKQSKIDGNMRRVEDAAKASSEEGGIHPTIDCVYVNGGKKVIWDPGLDAVDDGTDDNNFKKRMYGIDTDFIRMYKHKKMNMVTAMRIPAPTEVAFRSHLQHTWGMGCDKLNSSFVMELA